MERAEISNIVLTMPHIHADWREPRLTFYFKHQRSRHKSSWFLIENLVWQYLIAIIENHHMTQAGKVHVIKSLMYLNDMWPALVPWHWVGGKLHSLWNLSKCKGYWFWLTLNLIIFNYHFRELIQWSLMNQLMRWLN